MKRKLLNGLLALAGLCTVIGGLDLTQILPLLPDHVAAWLAMALPVVITAEKLIVAIGDLLDDGKRNDSFRVGALALLLIPALLFALPSCGLSAADVAYRRDGYHVTYIQRPDGSTEFHYREISTSREYRAYRTQTGQWALEVLDPNTGLWVKLETDAKAPALPLPPA